MTFDAHAPVGRRVGMGLSMIADEIGPAKEQNLYADFSYTIPTSMEGNLAFGLKAGVTLLNVNLVDVTLPQTQTGDDPLFDENINDAFPNFGAGVYYYTEKFYVGFSVPNILKSEHLTSLIILFTRNEVGHLEYRQNYTHSNKAYQDTHTNYHYRFYHRCHGFDYCFKLPCIKVRDISQYVTHRS